MPSQSPLEPIKYSVDEIASHLHDMIMRGVSCAAFDANSVYLRKDMKSAYNDGTEVETDQDFYHSDHLGSSSFITNINGAAVQHLQYLPFGETFVDQRHDSPYNTPYKFSGKEKDDETQYSYFGARYYDSDLSVWLSVDHLCAKYPSMSPYMYCGGNPINYIDPNGKFKTKAGAFFYKLFHGGEIIKDKNSGQYFVGKQVKPTGDATAEYQRRFGWNGEKKPITEENGKVKSVNLRDVLLYFIPNIYGNHSATNNGGDGYNNTPHKSFWNDLSLDTQWLMEFFGVYNSTTNNGPSSSKKSNKPDEIENHSSPPQNNASSNSWDPVNLKKLPDSIDVPSVHGVGSRKGDTINWLRYNPSTNEGRYINENEVNPNNMLPHD